MALKKSIAGRAFNLAKAGVEKAKAPRHSGSVGDGSLPMTVTSHDKGKNATVTLYADRIERVLERSALSLSRANQQAEVIPVAAVSSVAARKDGMVYTVVSALSASGSIDFRLSHDDAEKFRGALTALVLGQHAPPASAQSDIAAQLRELADLHAQGVLNDDEFSQAKARLIG